MKNRKKHFILCFTFLLCLILITSVYLIKQHRKEAEEQKKIKNTISIGFSQVGAESDWRTANSVSIRETFSPEHGYDLLFSDAQQKQENQILAIRSFIQQGVDYIILAPVTENGWDTVLEEAKLAGIPVIIMDRTVNVADESLYTAWVGSDFYQQGIMACDALKNYLDENQIDEVNIAHIQGTLGASAQIGRTKALEEAAEKYNWTIVEQKSGDFTQAHAQEIMKSMLNNHDNINVVYCENDNETFGAIEAIEAAGKSIGPGGDIVIVSFDATKKAVSYVMNGRIIVDAECNPLQGPRVEKIIRQLEAGEKPPKNSYMYERLFIYGDVTTDTIRKRKY